MLEGFYQWIRNIVVYLIFMSLILKLLPEEKNVKYIKYFMGMILVLIVLAPAGRLFHLDETFGEFTRQLSGQEKTREFRQELELMGEEYASQVIGEYEADLAFQAGSFLSQNGYGDAAVRVTLDADTESGTFGEILSMQVDFGGGEEKESGSSVVIEKNQISILDEEPEAAGEESRNYREAAEEEAVRKALAEQFSVEEDRIRIRYG
ncbi:MAG TPA: stage III sporulation protein AF [Firmicutes bacterium]|nr:stage III sporulation protein AF [Bacillota bacterium]